MIRRRGSWWLVQVMVSERGKMLAAVLALCCCARLVAATPTEDPCPLGFYHVEGLCCELCKPDEEIDQPCTGISNTLCRCKAGLHKADGDEFCVQGGGKTAGVVVAMILLLVIVAAGTVFISKKKGGRFPCDGTIKFFTGPDRELGNSDLQDSTALPLLQNNTQNPEAGHSAEREPGNSNQQESTALGLLNWKQNYRGPARIEVRDMDESEAAKLIKGQRPELKKWIGRDPTYLLDYLDRMGLISRNKYHEACNITVKVERANFLIDEFINRAECLILWRALESLQDHYPHLEEWISACASTMPHSCEVRDMDESTAAKLIKRKRPELKKWIGRDPTYLLDYLDRMDLISRDKYMIARNITVKEERANFLIDEFIDRDECHKLWRALESLQDNYPQLTEWISACASTTHHTCEKAPGPDANVLYSTTPAGEVAANEETVRRLTTYSDEQLFDGIRKNMTVLVEAIEGDVQPLLTKLFEMEIFTLAEMNAVSTTQTNNGGFNAASQLITMLLHKGHRVAREFWMAFWNLKTNYPWMHNIFEKGLLIIEPHV